MLCLRMLSTHFIYGCMEISWKMLIAFSNHVQNKVNINVIRSVRSYNKSTGL